MSELNEKEEQEILNISDEGDEIVDDEQELDEQDEQDDRGDEFVDPEAEDDDADAGGDDGKGGEEEDSEDKGGEEEEDDDKHVGGVPFGRLNEVSRVKSAATAIADGIVDGLIDAQTIRDLGGANAVAKAVANKEITLDELKRFDAGTTGAQPGKDGAPEHGPSDESTSWNLDDKYVEYQELVDAGETKEAAQLLRQINREERIRDRAEETAKQQQATLDVYVSQLMTEYPVLADVKSREHEEVMVWANHLQATQRITRQAALEKAVTRVFPNGKAAGSAPGNDGKASSETAQERAIRERKEAAVRRGAKASRQQPPPMDLGATPNSPTKLDPANMTDEEFEQLSESEKKKYRGDFV